VPVTRSGGEDTRFVEFDEFLREVFRWTATDGLWLKPCQAMICVGQSHLFCRMPLMASLSGPGSTLFSHFFRGASVSGLHDHLSHQPFEFSEALLKRRFLEHPELQVHPRDQARRDPGVQLAGVTSEISRATVSRTAMALSSLGSGFTRVLRSHHPKLPLSERLSGPGSTLFSHFFRGTWLSVLHDPLSHQPFEFSEALLELGLLEHPEL
jgi:hypothetical protein